MKLFLSATFCALLHVPGFAKAGSYYYDGDVDDVGGKKGKKGGKKGGKKSSGKKSAPGPEFEVFDGKCLDEDGASDFHYAGCAEPSCTTNYTTPEACAQGCLLEENYLNNPGLVGAWSGLRASGSTFCSCVFNTPEFESTDDFPAKIFSARDVSGALVGGGDGTEDQFCVAFPSPSAAPTPAPSFAPTVPDGVYEGVCVDASGEDYNYAFCMSPFCDTSATTRQECHQLCIDDYATVAKLRGSGFGIRQDTTDEIFCVCSIEGVDFEPSEEFTEKITMFTGKGPVAGGKDLSPPNHYCTPYL